MISELEPRDNVYTAHGPEILHHSRLPIPSTSLARKACIRRYRPEDREAVRRICCDTGFLGKPIDSIFRDRPLYADLLTAPYLDYETDWALVAEVQGRVVGYLLGSVRRDFDRLLMWTGFQTAYKMLFRLASGHYSGHARSRQFVRWVLVDGFWQRPKHPSQAAHLHFDLEAPYRGRCLGRRLWENFEEMLKETGVSRYYGEFFSRPGRRPESVYARYGFTVFDRRRTTLFGPDISNPVDVVCVSKWIESDRGRTDFRLPRHDEDYLHVD